MQVARCNYRCANVAKFFRPIAFRLGAGVIKTRSQEFTMPTKSRTYGPTPMDAKELRTHTISVRLNQAELTQLDKFCSERKLQRGKCLRLAFMKKLPPTIPSINQKAWLELSNAASDLNQIARHLNHGRPISIGVSLDALARFRASLLKAGDKL